MKKKTKHLMMIGLFGIGLLFLLFSFLWNKGKEISPPSKNPTDITEVSIEEKNIHIDYSPDTEKDPFKNKKTGTVTVQNIEFELPVNKDFYKQPNTHSVLTASNENAFLFHSFGDISYIYHKNYGERYILDQGIKEATMCTNNEQVAYISTFENNAQKVMSYNIGFGRNTELYTAESGENITAIGCDNQKVAFTLEDANGNKTTKLVVLKEYAGHSKPSDTIVKVVNSSDFIVKNQNGMFVYEPTKYKLKSLDDVGITHDISIAIDLPATSIYSFDVNNQNEWLSVYFDENNQTKLAINGTTLDDFSSVDVAKWYNDEYALVLDISTLYLVNTKTNEKQVLTTDVSDYVVDNGDIYYHNAIGELFYLKKK